MAQHIFEKCSDFTGFTRSQLIEIAEKAPTSYKKYQIAKKDGGKRDIYQPSKQTKAVQHALMESFLSKLPIHVAAVGYRRGTSSPLRKNAEMHAPYSYSIHLDFEDFFPSIRPTDLIHSCVNCGIRLEDDEIQFLNDILFLRAKDRVFRLAIGAPSSPMISNLVMYALDNQIDSTGKSISAESVYTRYADDIAYSTNLKGACRKFYERVHVLISASRHPKLKLNEKKTRLLSKGTKRVITGLCVTPDKTVSLGRENKRYLRKLLFEFKKGALNEKAISYLSGYLAFVLDVEPDLYNRLAIKYTAETLSQALHTR